ncbi:MAG: FISUMP domain-containing protein, partial [Bacteroidales bacterium]|nr:FISUMP domain-containing protein [Bacteroidales bacterium]
QGVQGICPLGWHLPTDEEWKVLEGAVDSQYGIGDPEWDIESEVRGYDAGMNLKTTRGWIENGNGTDLFGFSGLPGGFRLDNGNFGNVTIFDYRWTSTEDDNYVAWCRILGYYDPESFRGNLGKNYGFSIRCLRDE